MGENSKIEWTSHTFNPWAGCEKVSPGCDHCFAERETKAYGFTKWGKDVPRRVTSESYWKNPAKWNRQAQAKGERARVFCGSWCDVMEDRRELDPIRARLYRIVEETEWLDWLFLTKRPQNYRRLLPAEWIAKPRQNVWLMTTIESPAFYWRWAELAKTPAAIRGISYEPAIAQISLDEFCTFDEYEDWEGDPGVINGTRHFWVREMTSGPDWIVAGSETGPGARDAEWRWFQKLQRECEEYRVAFMFKQFVEGGAKVSLPILNGRQFVEFPQKAA